ncbi:alpha/beta hydrolase [Streptomyces uncialis]|uniref:alpha/beta hydrolase n=1 Tax=Streptomyces uncialis TaxID=1048205 RepID=UPI00378D50FF
MSDATLPADPPDTGAEVLVRTHDGLRLAGTLLVPPGHHDGSRDAALFLHGSGADREQGGLFTRVARGLADGGVATLRFDLPGHGHSEGRQAELSLSGLLNLIGSGLRELRERTGAARIAVLAAGLTGGVAAGYAARRGDEIGRLVLFDPLIDYQEHFTADSPRWRGGRLTEPAGRTLLADGALASACGLAAGRAMLNEVFWLQPRGVLGAVTAPTLIVHGTGAARVPVASSRSAAGALTAEHRLVELPPGGDPLAGAASAALAWLLPGTSHAGDDASG